MTVHAFVAHKDHGLSPEKGTEDWAFDSIYPPYVRAMSRRYWTPVDVARRAARMLWRAGARSVLDVGSGVGKFVLIAAAEVPAMCVVGIEQRRHLVEVARRAQARLSVPNAFLWVGEANEVPWTAFDGFYFFNPFAENLFADEDQLDDEVERTKARFVRDVLRVEHALSVAPLGTVVVTYHGMSGRMPACYEPSQSTRAGSDWLRLWVKTQERAEGFFLEDGDDIVLHRANETTA